jgi:hypothetical protein
VANHYEVAEIFDTFNLTIMGVHATTEAPINELFVRLNRNKPLTGAEIRNAMSGPAPQIIRSIRDHDFFTSNIAFSFTRGADLNAAAKLLRFEFSGKPVDTKKKVLDDFVISLERQDQKDLLELAARRVNDSLDTMSEIFLPRDKLLSSGGLLPVYYWFCREQDNSSHHLIREFLVQFEEERKYNRASFSDTNASTNKSSNINQDYVAFDNYNRSTNDLNSHIGRFEILRKLFSEWRVKSSKKPSRKSIRPTTV